MKRPTSAAAVKKAATLTPALAAASGPFSGRKPNQNKPSSAPIATNNETSSAERLRAVEPRISGIRGPSLATPERAVTWGIVVFSSVLRTPRARSIRGGA